MKKKLKDASKGQEAIFTLEDFRSMATGHMESLVRARTIEFVADLMQEEVELLCGRAFQHKSRSGLAHRGGSERGTIYLNGEKLPVKKPRVRQDNAEVPLETYAKLHSSENLGDMVFKTMLAGISTRSYDAVIRSHAESLGVSKSTVSREFIKKSRGALNEINTRRFADRIFWALLIDGIHIGGDVIVVAMGVDISGEKRFLGVSQGSTENAEVVKDLLASLADREIRFTERLVGVIDGGKALRKGLLEHFGSRVEIQRCLIHKKRNVYAYLAKKHHGELSERMNQAYSCNDYPEAEQEFGKTIAWLERINHNAAESLREGMPDLLILHRIGVPPALRKSLYTTNLIESGFAHPRFKLNRVKRWNKQADMIKRWAGANLLEQEKTFRRVRAFREIESFLANFIERQEEKIDSRQTA